MTSPRTPIARVALYAAGAVLAAALVLLVVGSVRFRLLGVVISASGPGRPLAAAAALLLVSLIADRAVAASAARSLVVRPAGVLLPLVVGAVSRPAWACVWCVATAVFIASLALGSRAAAGADSSGYVAQASLWADGELIQPVTLASAVPWPYAVSTFAPLGFTPAPGGAKIVPSYAAGLPLLMAVFRLTAGPCAVFWIVPLCSGAVVLLTYALGLRVTSPLAALGGTLLIAASPTMLFMTLWPMSDVPVTAFWLAALVLALRTPARPLAVGVLTGIAILIRPNLAPLALVPVALLAVNAWPQPRPRLVKIVAVSSVAIALFALIVAAIHTYLYGGPLRSGYGAGDASKLYAVANIVPNIKQYGGWLFQSQGVLAVVAVLAWMPQLLWRTSPTHRLLAVFAAIVAASYLPYIVFDDWWYLRFFLPALPILYLFAAALIARAIARFGTSVQATVTTAVVLAMCGHALAFAFQKEIFGIGEGEQRYVDVGRFVRDELPRSAVILAMQHGGSIRYYAGNTTIRYDLLTTARLDQAVDLLRGWQYGPYLVLEDWEEPLFRDRFKEQQTVRTLDRRLLAVLDSNTSVRIYDLSEQAVPPSPRTIKHIPRTRCCGRFDEE